MRKYVHFREMRKLQVQLIILWHVAYIYNQRKFQLDVNKKNDIISRTPWLLAQVKDSRRGDCRAQVASALTTVPNFTMRCLWLLTFV